MSALVTRIFSDLHYRDGASRLHRLAALAPLLAGADHLVINGDTLDSQAPHAGPLLAEARDFFKNEAPRVTLLSGNHDPDISPHTELLLNEDRVWITHGDVLCENVAPWSSRRDELAKRLQSLATTVPPETLYLVETRLRLNRLACHHLPDPHDCFDRSLHTRLVRLAHALFPPNRLLSMVNTWHTTPALARALAREQRPRARLIVVGHTHFPGVWRDADGPVVVNTGSFSRPFGGLFVELCGDKVQVVRIVQKNGEFHRGRVVAGFSLAP